MALEPYSNRLTEDGFDHPRHASESLPLTRVIPAFTLLVLGGNLTSAATHLGDAGSNALAGDAAGNRMVGGQGGDVLAGNGGPDVMHGGAGDDVLAVRDAQFRRVHGGGGSDTLRLDGPGFNLDLTALADSRLTGIEVIDLTGPGNHILTLNVREVLNLSSASNTLLVRRNAGDTVHLGGGWSAGS